MKKLIAIIDDERLLIDLIGKALEKRGFNVCGFTDGTTALASFLAQPPDLVIVDYYFLEGPSGLEICHKIKTTDRTKHIPVLMATGMAFMKEPTGGDPRLEKPDSVLIKPFEMVDLLQVIERLLPKTEPSTNGS